MEDILNYANSKNPEDKKKKEDAQNLINEYDLDNLYNFNVGGYALRGELNTSTKVLKDLVKLPKKYINHAENKWFLISKNEIGEFGRLEFVVNFRKISNVFHVELILKESKAKSGGLEIDYELNTIKTITLPDDEYLEKDVCREFNISKPLGNGKIHTEIDYEPLEVLRARRYLYVLAGHVVFASSAYNQKLLQKRLELLENSEVGRLIFNDFHRFAQLISPTMPYEEALLLKNQFLTNSINKYSHLFAQNKNMFIELRLALAQYRNAMLNIINNTMKELDINNFNYNPTFDVRAYKFMEHHRENEQIHIAQDELQL